MNTAAYEKHLAPVRKLLDDINVMNSLSLVAYMNDYIHRQRIGTLTTNEFEFLKDRLRKIKIGVDQVAHITQTEKDNIVAACLEIMAFIESRKAPHPTTHTQRAAVSMVRQA
ncbi:hypothetical protein [Musicola paradisiaca]|uniref:Uncharacterized protein n=1 Tax=Musicola paradisiaca (strain Ech703) TaxID=579405 RepID=C6C7J0_MUSP7|nr:hypothetical protein [Musicola paradisiaca]ACS84108.1 hypothetical protein Dd703_0291 [Musicola paradisiaca Ech703]